MAARLDDAKLAEALALLPTWKHEGTAIVRQHRSPTFRAAVRLVNRIADLAEGANHHPDLALSWASLRISLSTHDAGGLTTKDFHLARCIEDVIAEE